MSAEVSVYVCTSKIFLVSIGLSGQMAPKRLPQQLFHCLLSVVYPQDFEFELYMQQLLDFILLDHTRALSPQDSYSVEGASAISPESDNFAFLQVRFCFQIWFLIPVCSADQLTFSTVYMSEYSEGIKKALEGGGF